jgi:AbrB family looped-hinge helix DNA binding protein
MSRQRVKIAPGGRIVIPAKMRAELGFEPGEHVILECVDGELRVRSLRAAIKRAQDFVRRYIPDDDRSLVDELIADRREEALRECRFQQRATYAR